HVPKTFEEAKNDGERWRYCMEQAASKDPALRPSVDWEFAQFLQSQFGVQTLRQGGFNLPVPDANSKDDARANLWSLNSLSDEETICRLASGPRRLTLPEEFNPLAWLKKIGAENKQFAAQAADQIAQIYEDRQQYVKAAKAWKEALAKFGNDNNSRQSRIDQIEKPWGVFESTSTQPAGQGATLEFKFRNGKKLSLESWPIKVDLLLADMKAHLKSNPKNLDWQQVQLDQVGYRLVQQNQLRYLDGRNAQWTVDLDPRESHFDRRTTITTPLQKPGAYLVTAKLDGGNVSRIVVWVADTAIVKKAINGGAWSFLADAVSGAAIPNVDVEFFGWRHEYRDQGRRHDVIVKNFAEKTDANGQIVPDGTLQDQQFQWMAIAKSGQRLAFLGFSGVWRGQYHVDSLNQTKVVLITDRPVYRPDQKVEFKFWVRPVSYDLTPEQSKAFANQSFNIQLVDPMGVEVWKKPFTTDEFGGIAGEHLLPKDAKLGSYSLNIVDNPGVGGGGQFRVEEYKKPEFMVEVDAPKDPVSLGEKVAATIRAKYLFGALVTNATVKYRVERTPYTERWFPRGEWDWLYGPGYWWFSSDDTWYPGFSRWGCFAPRPSWFHWNPDPPELVLDAESPIGADGTVKIEIDTSLAKVLHGDEDHSYKITAEVVDASRRTIVGGGNVLVAREPFRVFVWLNRGHYRAGDMIRASAQVRTLDGKPVSGKGKLTLLKVSYDKDGKPTEQNVGEWAVDPNEQGEVSQEIKAADAGQYRIAYSLTHAVEGKEAVTKEGAQLFVVRGESFSGSDFHFSDLELVPDKKEYAPGESIQ
ncbi:MAG TPA: MG2 domain-containing protein, partial [Caulifigura sp.]|nr:MG2 domain-containing protein [Caulifigura sp.]